MYKKIVEEVRSFSDSNFANWLKPFLSITEISEEIVWGVRTPMLRKLAKKYNNIEVELLENLLKSNIHELKSLAIHIMLLKKNQNPILIKNLYLKNLDYINNWDLVDYSAPYIIAPYVEENQLRELADSDYLWANRVAMVATIHFIRQNNFNLALEFAEKFMYHPHHLMHKAAGWMLREIGKRNEKVLIEFLDKYYLKMPAIMRSYAKEKINYKNKNF